jgi:predicted dehydrogenase
MAKTLRIGLIGAGANTRLRHIPGLKAIENV